MSKKARQRRYRRDDILKVTTRKGSVTLQPGQHFWEYGGDIEIRENVPEGSRLVQRIPRKTITHVVMEA